MEMRAVESATDRYGGLLKSFVLDPELRVDALKKVIDEAGDKPVPALSERIAKHTQLTAAQAKPIVETALAATPDADSETKATEVHQSLADALPSISLELSEAVMLKGGVRVGFASVFGVLLFLCMGAVLGLGLSSKPSEIAIVAFVVMAIFALVSVLVLVMGYKTAKVKLGSAAS